jgi:hypothetical protein
MEKYKNTPKRGSVRYIVFKERQKWVGVALEFNIVEVGDDAQEVTFLLFEAIQGYVESLRKIKGLRDFSSLNQKPDKEYENLWKLAKSEKPIPSPFQVDLVGRKVLA